MSIFEIFRLNKRRSTLAALKNIYGAKLAREIVVATPDRRSIFESASRVTGATRIEIMRKVGENLSLPILENIPKFHETPELACLDRDKLLESAVAPITNGGIHMGFACVDPHIFDLMFRKWSCYPLFLSSWSAISATLGQEQGNVSRDQSKPDSRSALDGFLVNMGKRLEQYSAKEILIDFENGLNFVIPLSNEKSLEGKVKAELVDLIRAAVIELISNENSAFVLVGNQAWTLTKGQVDTAFRLVPYMVEEPTKENISEQTSQSSKEELLNSHRESIDVLLVDDNDAFGSIVERFLGKHNITSKRFRNGSEAFSWISSGKGIPKAIVTDLHMPVMNGFELVRRLSSSEYSLIPVVVLTSDEDPEAEISMISDGVETFVKKNQDPRLLCLHIKRILSRETKKAA